jgi:hypothetical protein
MLLIMNGLVLPVTRFQVFQMRRCHSKSLAMLALFLKVGNQESQVLMTLHKTGLVIQVARSLAMLTTKILHLTVEAMSVRFRVMASQRMLIFRRLNGLVHPWARFQVFLTKIRRLTSLMRLVLFLVDVNLEKVVQMMPHRIGLVIQVARSQKASMMTSTPRLVVLVMFDRFHTMANPVIVKCLMLNGIVNRMREFQVFQMRRYHSTQLIS